MKDAQPNPRPSQDTPEALVNRLLGQIRNQFCGDLDEKAWYRDHYHWLKRNVVLWPARFMWGKGFTLPAARYEQIMLAVFQDIKRHGQTGQVRYWPAYLMKCVQDHWHHHWEEYYGEAKSARALAEAAMLALQARQAPADQTTEALAMAHQVLVGRRRRQPRSTAPPPAAPKQLGLFPS